MRFVATTLLVNAGVIVWAGHFGTIYGLGSLACARGAAAAVQPLVLSASAVAVTALAVALGLAWRARRGEAFADRLALGVGGFALVAIAYETVAALVIPPCT
jgi:hypothetical protein